MRFVIATLPDVKFNLGRDLSLVKACVVYGDETVLFSPTYAGTAPLLDFTSRPLLHQLIYLSLLRRDPGFVVGEKLTKKDRAARIRSATAAGAELLSKATVALECLTGRFASDSAATALAKIAAEIAPMCRAVGTVLSAERDVVRRAQELTKAEQLGLVKIENIHDVPSLFYSPSKLRADVRAALSRADSYGALDERFLSRLDNPSPATTQKLRAARVGAEVLSTLPGFAAATFEEIRDIRTALAPHLAAFRKGIIDLAGKIESAPWDRDFLHDVERQLRLHVHPAVSEIEAQMHENSYLTEIVHRAARNPLLLPATSAFGLLLSSASHTPALVAEIASALGGAGLLAFEARQTWKATRSKIAGNEFFFYYQASVLLNNPPRWSRLLPNKRIQPAARRARRG